MRLPTRYDLSTHCGGAQLLWNDAAGDAEDAQWEFLDVMCFNHVLTTTDGSEVVQNMLHAAVWCPMCCTTMITHSSSGLPVL